MRFDSAWIPEENIYLYSDHRDKFKLEKRIPKGFKEALEAIEDELKEKPFIVRKHDWIKGRVDLECLHIWITNDSACLSVNVTGNCKYHNMYCSCTFMNHIC